jgi:hypothetical protein
MLNKIRKDLHARKNFTSMESRVALLIATLALSMMIGFIIGEFTIIHIVAPM